MQKRFKGLNTEKQSGEWLSHLNPLFLEDRLAMRSTCALISKKLSPVCRLLHLFNVLLNFTVFREHFCHIICTFTPYMQALGELPVKEAARDALQKSHILLDKAKQLQNDVQGTLNICAYEQQCMHYIIHKQFSYKV